MPPLPRSTCPVCTRDVPTRVSGQLREHTTGDADGRKCPGSGRFPDHRALIPDLESGLCTRAEAAQGYTIGALLNYLELAIAQGVGTSPEPALDFDNWASHILPEVLDHLEARGLVQP